MKHNSLKIICLIIWASITVLSAYSNDTAVSLESRILESFNGDDDARYIWRTEASRFITVQDDIEFPVIQFVEAWPVTVFGYHRPDGAPPIRSLGIHGRFDRRGYNWIDLYPVSAEDPDAGPVEIPIPGIVRNMDLWVWGSNLRFYIEVYVRDYRGVVFPLKLGDIDFIGWRNLSVNIPRTINQTRRTAPTYAGLTFVKFRIWTQPIERVDNFYIYFKQLKVLTDMYDPLFDGNDLANPENVQRLWANN